MEATRGQELPSILFDGDAANAPRALTAPAESSSTVSRLLQRIAWGLGTITTGILADATATAQVLPPPPGPKIIHVKEAGEGDKFAHVREIIEKHLLKNDCTNVQWNGRTVSFTHTGNRLSATMLPNFRFENFTLASPHVDLRLDPPVLFIELVQAAKNLPKSAAQIGKRGMLPKEGETLQCSGKDSIRIDFTAGKQQYVATPFDVLTIVSQPSAADWEKWRAAAKTEQEAQHAHFTLIQKHVNDKVFLNEEGLGKTLADARFIDLLASDLTKRINAKVAPDARKELETVHSKHREAHAERRKREEIVTKRMLRDEGDGTLIEEWDSGITDHFGFSRSRNNGQQSDIFVMGQLQAQAQYAPDHASKRTTIFDRDGRKESLRYETKGPRGFEKQWTEHYHKRTGKIVAKEVPGQPTIHHDSRGIPSHVVETFPASGKDAPKTRTSLLVDGRRLGTLAHERTKNPKMAEAEYFALLCRALDTPEKLAIVSKEWWHYVHDTPDPKDPLREGTEDDHGDYIQTVHETLRREKNGKFCGDCDDIAWLFRSVLREQKKNAQMVIISVKEKNDKKSSHALCLWLEKRPDGRFDIYTACNFGVSRNGEKLDLSDDDHKGFATIEDALRAFTVFYKNSGAEPVDPTCVTFAKDVRDGKGDFYNGNAAYFHPDMGRQEEHVLLPPEHELREIPEPDPRFLFCLLMSVPPTVALAVFRARRLQGKKW